MDLLFKDEVFFIMIYSFTFVCSICLYKSILFFKHQSGTEGSRQIWNGVVPINSVERFVFEKYHKTNETSYFEPPRSDFTWVQFPVKVKL